MRVWAKGMAANMEDGSQRPDLGQMSEVKTWRKQNSGLLEHGECGSKVKDDSEMVLLEGPGGWSCIRQKQDQNKFCFRGKIMSSDWDRLRFGYYGALHVDVARKFRKHVWSLVSMAGSQYPRLSD